MAGQCIVNNLLLILISAEFCYTKVECLVGGKCETEDSDSINKTKWAIGAEVTITHQASCQADDPRCRYFIWYGSSQETVQSSMCNDSWGTHGLGNETYRLKCSIVDKRWSFELKILDAPPGNFYIEIHGRDNKNADKRMMMRFCFEVTGCSNGTGEVLVASQNTTHLSHGTFICSDSSKAPHYRNFTEPNTTLCNLHAEWQNIGDVLCFQAPNVSLVGNYSEKYEEKMTVTFTCAITSGIPNTTQAEICIGSQHCLPDNIILPTASGTAHFRKNVTMVPEYNGVYVTCNASNGYMSDEDKKRLSIRFGPYKPVINVSECTRFLDHLINATLEVRFYVNPLCSELQLGGTENNIPVENGTIDTDSTCGNSSRQYFKYKIFNFNLSEYNSTTFECSPSGSVKEVINFSSRCDRPSTTVMSMLTKTLIAVAGGISFLVIVLLTILGHLRWRKRCSTSKSELLPAAAANPVFDDSSMTERSSERQDRLNVLYGTLDDPNSKGTTGKVSVYEIVKFTHLSSSGRTL